MSNPQDLTIASDRAELTVSTAGGIVWRFDARTAGGTVPLFRAAPEGAARAAPQSGCFPLVPFGNRVRGNRFHFEGRDHTFVPNMAGDRHYLHGDGWLGEWQVARQGEAEIVLGFHHPARDGTPYDYDAEQHFRLEGSMLTMALNVTNRGDTALPFGLGWHPYFPLTPETTLEAAARSLWDEDESWLPTTERAVFGDLDFSVPRRPPRRWVNALFEGWDGHARILWPERRLSLAIEADPLFSRYMLFVSDPAFDPCYDYGSFCFEPMSHSVDAHNMASGGGLRRLGPGESLSGALRCTWAADTA